MAVLRMGAGTVNKNWNIWQMQDTTGKEQLAVRLNGESGSLEFTFTAADAGARTVVFGPLPSLFNDRWHRVLLDVGRRSVALFVDCVGVGAQSIPLRERVSLDGFTLIGKLKDNPVTAIPVRPLRLFATGGRPAKFPPQYRALKVTRAVAWTFNSALFYCVHSLEIT